MDIHVYLHTDPSMDTALLRQILNQGDCIMSAISDFAAKQSKFITDSTAAVAAVSTAVDGVTADIAALNAKIEELQNSPGAITPEDQALLDGLTTAGDELSVKLTAMSDALTALDGLTPPVPPVV